MNRAVLCVVFILILAGASVLFSNPQQARSDTGQPSNIRSPNSNSIVSSYDNVTTHEGDLVIDGTQTFVIENCTYIQTGSIQVRDWGRLIVRNSELRINQTYLQQYDFVIEDYGTLELENSIVTSDQILSFDFNEHSRANINNVTLDLPGGSDASFNGFSKATIRQLTFPRVGWGTLFLNDHSEASITNSQIQEIQVWDGECSIETSNSSITWFSLSFNSGYEVKVDHLKPGFYEYLNLQEKVTIPSIIYDVTLNNTLVDMWAVHIYYDSKTAISDSIIGRLLIFIQGLFVRLDNLRPQFYEYKQMGQISLNNTSITTYIVVLCRDSIVTIANSTVDLSPYFDSDVYVVDSLVALQTQNFSGSLGFERTTLRNRMLIFYADFFMYGNVSFEDVQEIELLLINIKRNYNIILRDYANNPMENAGLILLDQKNTVVWNGTTDSLGQANFNVTFTDSNYTDTLTLNISREGFYNETKDFGFLSDTPVSIVLTVKIPGDLNWDKEVSLADLVILAQAYGSKPGDSSWNPKADIDGNGIVGLSDLVALAQHYGQHYP
jgi:hypothetical protein